MTRRLSLIAALNFRFNAISNEIGLPRGKGGRRGAASSTFRSLPAHAQAAEPQGSRSVVLWTRGTRSCPSKTLFLRTASTLPSVTVESYNVEVKDEDGFVGDRARKAAFVELLTKWRKVMRKGADDPFGGEDIDTVARKQVDDLLIEGTPEAASVVQSAIEEFAQELATVFKRFQKLKAWRDTQRLVVGGGFRARRVGELAIGRAAALLKEEQPELDMQLIRNDRDDAGLIGAVHLAPPWIFKGHNAVLAVDIGGTNIRAAS